MLKHESSDHVPMVSEHFLIVEWEQSFYFQGSTTRVRDISKDGMILKLLSRFNSRSSIIYGAPFFFPRTRIWRQRATTFQTNEFHSVKGNGWLQTVIAIIFSHHHHHHVVSKFRKYSSNVIAP